MSETFNALDRECMTRAIAAAAQVRCATSPNPWVGAVVRAADGTIAEGATREVGRDHAEIVALKSAGGAARGSTVYVTLEPCSHTGRTGPCADALIEAGVARVVVAMADPDARVNGQGVERLRAAGITVDVGLYEDRVRQQLAPYIKHRTTGRPWVVLKLAASMDGFTAAPDGSSQWITGPAARADGHRRARETELHSAAAVLASGALAEPGRGTALRHEAVPAVLAEDALGEGRASYAGDGNSIAKPGAEAAFLKLHGTG